MEALRKIFPELGENQWAQLELLGEAVRDWNTKINVISRKDIDSLEERHILPSLALGKICRFVDGTTILDVGTGGGFPGIPLAIMFPGVSFTLIDSIGKKVRVVKAIVEALGLKNVQTKQIRVEDFKEPFDFVIGRAVTDLDRFLRWVKKNVKAGDKNPLANGILYLKGGESATKSDLFGKTIADIYWLEDYLGKGMCTGKCMVYYPYPILR